jgi:hypothetical protein
MLFASSTIPVTLGAGTTSCGITVTDTSHAVSMTQYEAQQWYAAQQAMHSNTYSAPLYGRYSETNLGAILNMRMGWNLAASTSFKKVSAHKLSDDKAAVFVIVGEKALVIEDDLNLFPSDALVTQLRLLEGA